MFSALVLQTEFHSIPVTLCFYIQIRDSDGIEQDPFSFVNALPSSGGNYF